MKKQKVTKTTYVKKRHGLYYAFFKACLWPYVRIIRGYKPQNKYKINKGETVFVLSNHQTDFDPLFIQFHFNKPIYFVATDSVFSNKWANLLFRKVLGMIPKRKGMFDMESNKIMYDTFCEGGSIGSFPEGNRTYAEFQFYIPDVIPKIAKYFKATLVLFNLHGGTGVRPRFSKNRRKGKLYGNIRTVLKYDDYKDMPDKELYTLIKDSLRVFDSDSGNKYVGKDLAEYLEREFFVCPVCGQKEQIYSEGDYVYCRNCGMKVKMGEDLLLHPEDNRFKFNKFIEWYNYQKEWIKKFEPKENEPIFTDVDIKLFTANPFEERVKIYEGGMKLFKDRLVFDDEHTYPIKDISICSPISGTRFTFTIDKTAYLIKGHERFNPLKYALIFNKLDTKMKIEKKDFYYTLD